MSRHLAPVPPERRIIGGTLAAGTIVLLGSMIVMISENPNASGTEGSVSAGISNPTEPVEPGSADPTGNGSALSEPIITQVPLFADPTAGSPPATAPTASEPTDGGTGPSTTDAATTRPPSTDDGPSTTTAPTASSTTSTSTTTIPPIVLGPDGLGVTDLGDGYDEAMERLVLSLGLPESDTGWISSISDVGTCPGEIVRIVRWAGLRTFFSDGPTEYGSDERHLFYFSQSRVEAEEPADLTTSEGIGLGSTVAELEAGYGTDVAIVTDLQFGPQFMIDPPGPNFMSGTLTGTSDDDVVTSIAGGFGCGA